MKRLLYFFVPVVAFILLGTSCASRKNVVYLNDIPQYDTLYAKIESQLAHNIQFRPGDKLSIVVKTRNKELSDMFNLAAHQNTNGRTTSNYTIDEMGEIDFPFLGKIRIAGLDRMQTEAYIKQKLIDSELIKEPYISVDYSNVGFYTLGEIGKGFHVFTQDRTTILEAISMSGDLNIDGLRKNILVIRRNLDGSESTYRVDLTNREQLYHSPAYYIQQNDIIYVEPDYKRVQESTINGRMFSTYSVWISLLSTSMTVFLFFRNLKR